MNFSAAVLCRAGSPPDSLRRYGHSWELDSLNLWDGLGEILDYVCGWQGVTYLSNGEASRFLTTSAAVSRQGL
jgi:hypothetical protein